MVRGDFEYWAKCKSRWKTIARAYVYVCFVCVCVKKIEREVDSEGKGKKMREKFIVSCNINVKDAVGNSIL